MRKAIQYYIVRYLIIYPIVLYFSFLVFLFFAQKSLVYLPDNTPFRNCINFEEDEKKSYKETNFYEKKWKNENVIVFFHWNAGRACDRDYIKWIFENTNSSIIFVEYFGYWDPDNSPNIKSILNDARNIWEYVNKNKDYQNIFVAWRSVWTWPASYYASRFKTDKLLLISPYPSLAKVWADKYPIFPVKYVFSENYESEKYLSDYKNDLLIIHGEKDKVVPAKFWKELFESVDSEKKEIFLKENLGHNDIFRLKEVWKKVVEFLR